MPMKAISLLLFQLLTATLALAQLDPSAQDAIDRGQYVRAIEILSQAVKDRPTADTYLYLGISYGHMREFDQAHAVLNEGIERYPEDPRFHNEIAKLFLENNDTDSARSELQRALLADPNDSYASDMLATIDLSEGDVQSALRAWNKTGRPVINDILHNYYLTFGSSLVRRSVAFHPSGVLKYSQWKTTEARLFETDNFSNVGLEIEPTRIPDQYNAVVRTTSKTNTLPDFLFNLVKGTPIATSYVDVWNIANSGINFNGNYRWDTDRRRAEGHLKIPLALPGILYIELGDKWRAERWDLSPNIRPEYSSRARFDYKANALQFRIKQIPDYRLELGGGFEYRNRAAKGDLPELSTDSTNTGRFSAEANLRLFDRRYQNRLHLEGFAARRDLIGDAEFTGGVAQLDNRVTLSKDPKTYINWSLKGGTARGKLPVEDYFVLGLDLSPTNLLRGHTAADHGQYGNGPMGSDFALVNTDFNRELATLPFFNNLNIPFLSVSWQVFFDGAKTWDRNRIFQPSKLLLDTGGGFRLETPTYSFNLIYGKSLRDGKNVFFAYYERRLW